jgi:hypothetical protein
VVKGQYPGGVVSRGLATARSLSTLHHDHGGSFP